MTMTLTAVPRLGEQLWKVKKEIDVVRKAKLEAEGDLAAANAIVIYEEVIHHFHDILAPRLGNTGYTFFSQWLVIWDIPEWENLPH